MSKLFPRSIPRTLAYWGLKFYAWLFQFIPFGLAKAIGYTLLPVAYVFVKRHRVIAKETLQLAFGDTKSTDEIKQISKKCFTYMGLGMVEMAYYMNHAQETFKRIKLVNSERLDAALARGKGVILVCAHFGNFPLMMLRLAQEDKYPVNMILRPTRNPKIGEFLHKKEMQNNMTPIYSKPEMKCIGQTLKVLRNNEIVFLPIDQNFEHEGAIFVDFLGKEASTSTSPYVFANRTGAAIIPVFMVRDMPDQHRIIFEEAIPIESDKTEQEAAVLTMTAVTKVIEKYILQYPYEWAWMHRRWKTRPKASPAPNTM